MNDAVRNDAETVVEIEAHDIHIQPIFDKEMNLSTYLITGSLVEKTTEYFYDAETDAPAGVNETKRAVHAFTAQLAPAFVAGLMPEGTAARNTALSNEVKKIVRAAKQKHEEKMAAMAVQKAEDEQAGRKRSFTPQEVEAVLGFSKLTAADLV